MNDNDLEARILQRGENYFTDMKKEVESLLKVKK